MSKSDWQLARIMSPMGYQRAIMRLGMNQSSAARYLGISPRTSRRYVEGSATVPTSTSLLLNALVDLGIKPKPPRPLKPDGAGVSPPNT